MSLWWLLSYLALWLVVLGLGFLLLGVLRALSCLGALVARKGGGPTAGQFRSCEGPGQALLKSLAAARPILPFVPLLIFRWLAWAAQPSHRERLWSGTGITSTCSPGCTRGVLHSGSDFFPMENEHVVPGNSWL
jgi:hypothetical protein